MTMHLIQLKNKAALCLLDHPVLYESPHKKLKSIDPLAFEDALNENKLRQVVEYN